MREIGLLPTRTVGGLPEITAENPQVKPHVFGYFAYQTSYSIKINHSNDEELASCQSFLSSSGMSPEEVPVKDPLTEQQTGTIFKFGFEKPYKQALKHLKEAGFDKEN